jgi:hypothetical protein
MEECVEPREKPLASRGAKRIATGEELEPEVVARRGRDCGQCREVNRRPAVSFEAIDRRLRDARRHLDCPQAQSGAAATCGEVFDRSAKISLDPPGCAVDLLRASRHAGDLDRCRFTSGSRALPPALSRAAGIPTAGRAWLTVRSPSG